MNNSAYTKEELTALANTIMKHIGIKTLAFTGAHAFGYGVDDKRAYLRFQASGKNFKRGLYITIYYDRATDLYEVTAIRIIKNKWTDLAKFTDVYASELSKIVETITDGDLSPESGNKVTFEYGGGMSDSDDSALFPGPSESSTSEALSFNEFEKGLKINLPSEDSLSVASPTHYYTHDSLDTSIHFDESEGEWIIRIGETGDSAPDLESAKKIAHSLNVDKIMKAGGGITQEAFTSIQMEFPVKISIIVPSTSDVSEEISNNEFKGRISEVESFLASLFGGYTETEADGGYIDEKANLVTERVSVIAAFATQEKFELNKSSLFAQVKTWCKEWKQEVIGVEISGELFYIGPSINEYVEQKKTDTQPEIKEAGGTLSYKSPQIEFELNEKNDGVSRAKLYETVPDLSYDFCWKGSPSLKNTLVIKDSKVLTDDEKKSIFIPFLKYRALAKGEIQMKSGGPVETWEKPDGSVYRYANSIRKNHPDIWGLGGNVFGNTAFEMLGIVVKRGYWLKEEEWFYKKWQSFKARHKKDYLLPGVIANLKWLFWVDRGEDYVRGLIEEKIKKSK
jgi:hypothetical protein